MKLRETRGPRWRRRERNGWHTGNAFCSKARVARSCFSRPTPPHIECGERRSFHPSSSWLRGAAIERGDLGDIITLTANQACVGHGEPSCDSGIAFFTSEPSRTSSGLTVSLCPVARLKIKYSPGADSLSSLTRNFAASRSVATPSQRTLPPPCRLKISNGGTMAAS
jgi:hypothetical protein